MKDHPPILKINVSNLDDKKIYQVVELRGEMDKVGLDQVKAPLEKLVESFGCKYLVFDCKELAYINSDSIGFLMSLHAHLAKENKHLVIVDARANVHDILEAIGVLTVFEYYANLEEFKKKIA